MRSNTKNPRPIIIFDPKQLKTMERLPILIRNAKNHFTVIILNSYYYTFSPDLIQRREQSISYREKEVEMEIFPALLLLYLDCLSPCFSRDSAPLFEGYVLGLLLTKSRKCMSRIASVCSDLPASMRYQATQHRLKDFRNKCHSCLRRVSLY